MVVLREEDGVVINLYELPNTLGLELYSKDKQHNDDCKINTLDVDLNTMDVFGGGYFVD